MRRESVRSDVRRRAIRHVQIEQRPPLANAAVVPHAALQDVRVGEDHLLAGRAADARALHADVLDRAVDIAELQRIADRERLVERDGHRGEQIAQHGLHGEGHRDAADAEAREQRLDLDAQVVEREQERHRPDREPRDEDDDVDGAGERRVHAAATLTPPADREAHGGHAPQPHLEPEGEHDGDLDAALDVAAGTRAA